MKQAKMKYVSPYQTDNYALRVVIEMCEPYGFTVERDPVGGRMYRIVNGDDVLTEYRTLAKLSLWMGGFAEGIKYQQK